jgi:Mg/Co/Ni transporter MgtE
MGERREDRDARDSLLSLALSNGVPRRAFLTALVVGTVLGLINQGDVMLAGQPPNLVKVALNYLVPYLVATYGAVGARRAGRG